MASLLKNISHSLEDTKLEIIRAKNSKRSKELNKHESEDHIGITMRSPHCRMVYPLIG